MLRFASERFFAWTFEGLPEENDRCTQYFAIFIVLIHPAVTPSIRTGGGQGGQQMQLEIIVKVPRLIFRRRSIFGSGFRESQVVEQIVDARCDGFDAGTVQAQT